MTDSKQDEPDRVSRVTSAGNSLVVVVPAKFRNQLGIEAGDNVEIHLNMKDGEITYKFLNIRQLNLV